MRLEQLEKLAQNPHFKLNPKQLAELEKLRNEQFKGKHKETRQVKHKTVVDKHDTSLPREDS